MLQFIEVLCATCAFWGNSAKHLSENIRLQCRMFSKLMSVLTFKKYEGTHLHVETGPFVSYTFTLSQKLKTKSVI